MPNCDAHAGGGRFATTQWSLILAAGDPSGPAARKALAALFEVYWPPIFAYLRRHGAHHDEALDPTQGFFATVLEKNYVADVRRERGGFRTFLLAALRHYVANEWDRVRTQRRGGAAFTVSLDAMDDARWKQLEPSHGLTPERVFERQWARTLLDRTLSRLRDESLEASDPRRVDRLVRYVFDETESGYATVATELSISEGAARVAVHRLRAQFRALLREEVERTVHDRDAVDDELRYLRVVLQA